MLSGRLPSRKRLRKRERRVRLHKETSRERRTKRKGIELRKKMRSRSRPLLRSIRLPWLAARRSVIRRLPAISFYVIRRNRRMLGKGTKRIPDSRTSALQWNPLRVNQKRTYFL